MALYLFRPDVLQLYYNCSFYSVDAVPLVERQHPLIGVGLISLFAVFELAYIPCMIVLWKHRQQSCYKFMLFIGVVDVCCLPVIGLLSGIFALQGAVYCSYPTLQLYMGVTSNFLWRCESTAAVCLALNRCVEIASPHKWSPRLYSSWRVWAWLTVILIYSIGFMCITKPSFFSSIAMAWHSNPHLGYFADTDEWYDVPEHRMHNNALLISLCSLYLVFIALFVKRRQQTSAAFHHDHSTRLIYIQAALISVINSLCSALYAYVRYFHGTPLGRWTPCAAHYLWVLVHGLPALIYLGMNRTIRGECAEMLGGWVRAGLSRLPSHAEQSITTAVANHGQHGSDDKRSRIAYRMIEARDSLTTGPLASPG